MNPATSSRDLVERAREGSEDAFRHLFEKYRPRLAVLIHYRLRPGSADVDDVLQETLLRAFRDINQFEYRSPGSFMGWLSRIADHAIADRTQSVRSYDALSQACGE